MSTRAYAGTVIAHTEGGGALMWELKGTMESLEQFMQATELNVVVTHWTVHLTIQPPGPQA